MLPDHWLELLVVLVIGLIVFGPRRVVDMGSALGKAFREFRAATRGLSWNELVNREDLIPSSNRIVEQAAPPTPSVDSEVVPSSTPVSPDPISRYSITPESVADDSTPQPLMESRLSNGS